MLNSGLTVLTKPRQFSSSSYSFVIIIIIIIIIIIVIINIFYGEKSFGSRIFLLYDINDTSVIFFLKGVFLATVRSLGNDDHNGRKKFTWKETIVQLWLFWDYPTLFAFYNIGELR